MEYIINDKTHNINILLLKEYYKFMGEYYSDGIGLRLYVINQNQNRMFIIVPVYWSIYTKQFVEINTHTQNKINQIKKLKNKDFLISIKNELVNNFLLKTTTFKEFYNMEEVCEFIKYISTFWGLSDDFSKIL